MKKLLSYILPFFIFCGVTYAQDQQATPDIILDSNVNPQLELMNNRKLDLRPADILPRTDLMYKLGDSNYRWLSINAGTIAVTNLSVTNLSGFSGLNLSTITASSGTITQLSVSSLTLTNLSSLFNLAVGTFTSKATTGSQSITGLGFKPRFIAFAMGAGGTDTTGYIGFGWGTAVKQVAAFGFRSDDTNSGGLATNSTTIIRWSDVAGNAVGQASLTSFDTDGFTLNWTAANAQTVTYFAIQ